LKTLFEAIENADAGAVWKLAKEGGELSAVDETTGLTPLAIAAEAGLVEIVRTLLEAGADPNFGGATTPLEAAVVEGHLGVVEALLARSADVNQKVEEGFTPLMTAAATGHLELVRTLLEAGAKPRLLNDDRQSAITLAESAGHDDVVEELKEAARRQRAANLEAKLGLDAAAPAEAVGTEPAEAVEAEPAEAAEAEPAEVEPAEAVDEVEAEEDPQDDLLGLAPEPEPLSLLVDAGESGADESTELFAPIDDDGSDAAAAVGGTVQTGGDELFAGLGEEVPAGEPGSVEDDAADAVEDQIEEVVIDDFAVGLGDFEKPLESYAKLAEAGSDAEIQKLVAEYREYRDEAGRTLLMAAAYQGEKELVQALIDAGAEVNACDLTESGQTALVYTVRSLSPVRPEILESLVAGGADVNQRCGRNRRSALMFAADADVYLERFPEPVFAQTTKELIRLGANLEARDRHGRTVWRLIKRDAIGAPTFSSFRRRLHQMLRVLEYNGAQQVASHKM
jgi:ankyrin repeat protein